MKILDRKIDTATLGPLPLLDINDETITSDRSNLDRWNTKVPGAIQYLVNQLGLHRKDDAGLALTEQQGIPPQCIER